MKWVRLRRAAARRSARAIAGAALLTGLSFAGLPFASVGAKAPIDTKTALREFGLTGTFSEDCAAGQSEAGAAERFEVPAVGDPTVVSRVKDHVSHMTITRARFAGDNKVVIDGRAEDGARYEITLEKSGDRIRIWRGVKDPDGSAPTTMVEDGMVPGTPVTIAWERRCEPTELGQRAR
jgi:hypothetical protein